MIIIIILYLLGTDKLCLPQVYFCSNNIDIRKQATWIVVFKWYLFSLWKNL